MNKLLETLDKFKYKKGFEKHGFLDDDSIKQMELELGIHFPTQYKTFLKNYGYIQWFGHAIFGYSADEDYDTVNCTKMIRKSTIPDEFERIPYEGCVLEDYGGGGYYFLFSKESNRSGEVALFTDEMFANEVQSWNSFENFLKYMHSL